MRVAIAGAGVWWFKFHKAPEVVVVTAEGKPDKKDPAVIRTLRAIRAAIAKL